MNNKPLPALLYKQILSFEPVIKLFPLKTWLFLFITFAFATNTFSQDLTGIWKGYFKSYDGESYKLEFQVAHKKNAYAASGVSYSYLDVRFYGKATMTGNYIASSKKFRIKEIRTVEVKSVLGGITCIMNYDLKYSRSGNEEYLEGTYLGRNERPLSNDTSYWGDCGGGIVFLRKVAETDFYLEPFLRKNATPLPPAKKEPVVKNNTPVNKPVTKPPVTKTPEKKKDDKPVIITPKKDTASKIIAPPIVNKDAPAQLPTPPVLKNRVNELAKSLVITDENVIVKLYDNGEIDDDTISVYMDKKLVLSSKKLTASPLILKFKMDEENPEHELVMVAENLGRIPPNTSLMIVEAGEQRFEVRITSTEQKNAVVKFRYEKTK